MLAACHHFEGVAPDYLNECACTANGANTVAVNTGGALVDGKPYKNTASVDVTIASAVGGGNTRIDRIVLRADWTAQTVRITLISGTDAASPTAPAITQTSGTTYDIMLCQVLVDTGGTVTVTDERTFATATAAEIANRTREFFVQAVAVRNTTDNADVARSDVRGWPMIDAKANVAYGQFTIPRDYAGTALNIYPVVIPLATGNCVHAQTIDAGAIASSEAYSTHAASQVETPEAVTINVLNRLSMISLTASTYAEDDLISLTFTRNGAAAGDDVGNTVYFLGWQVIYTADS